MEPERALVCAPLLIVYGICCMCVFLPLDYTSLSHRHGGMDRLNMPTYQQSMYYSWTGRLLYHYAYLRDQRNSTVSNTMDDYFRLAEHYHVYDPVQACIRQFLVSLEGGLVSPYLDSLLRAYSSTGNESVYVATEPTQKCVVPPTFVLRHVHRDVPDEMVGPGKNKFIQSVDGGVGLLKRGKTYVVKDQRNNGFFRHRATGALVTLSEDCNLYLNGVKLGECDCTRGTCYIPSWWHLNRQMNYTGLFYVSASSIDNETFLVELQDTVRYRNYFTVLHLAWVLDADLSRATPIDTDVLFGVLYPFVMFEHGASQGASSDDNITSYIQNYFHVHGRYNFATLPLLSTTTASVQTRTHGTAARATGASTAVSYWTSHTSMYTSATAPSRTAPSTATVHASTAVPSARPGTAPHTAMHLSTGAYTSDAVTDATRPPTSSTVHASTAVPSARPGTGAYTATRPPTSSTVHLSSPSSSSSDLSTLPTTTENVDYTSQLSTESPCMQCNTSENCTETGCTCPLHSVCNNGQCEPPCWANVCPLHAPLCINIYGTHECTVDFELCPYNMCGNNGICLEVDSGKRVCVCTTDYNGVYCEYPIESKVDICDYKPTHIDTCNKQCSYNEACFFSPYDGMKVCVGLADGTDTDGTSVHACTPDPCRQDYTCFVNSLDIYDYVCVGSPGSQGCTLHDCHGSGICYSAYRTNNQTVSACGCLDPSTDGCIHATVVAMTTHPTSSMHTGTTDQTTHTLPTTTVALCNDQCISGYVCFINSQSQEQLCAPPWPGGAPDNTDVCTPDPCRQGHACYVNYLDRGDYICVGPPDCSADCSGSGICYSAYRTNDETLYVCGCLYPATEDMCRGSTVASITTTTAVTHAGCECASGAVCMTGDDVHCTCPQHTPCSKVDVEDTHHYCMHPCQSAAAVCSVGTHCLDTFAGDHVCIPDDHDTTCYVANTCMNGGVCIGVDDDKDGNSQTFRIGQARNIYSYVCSCREGYAGSNCQHDIDECLSCPCENGATCRQLQDGSSYYHRRYTVKWVCECRQGYVGLRCQHHLPLTPCTSNPCSDARSTCIDASHPLWWRLGTNKRPVRYTDYTCLCVEALSDDAYTFEYCQEPSCSGGAHCLHGGTCIAEVGSDAYRCVCPWGYTGDRCETETTACSQHTVVQLGCSESSHCVYWEQTSVDDTKNFFCKCKHLFGGELCNAPSFSCGTHVDPNACGDHGVCEEYYNTHFGTWEYKCVCNGVYGGTHCDVVVSDVVDSWFYHVDSIFY